MGKIEFLSHILKELVDESIKDVASSGCCKITQKLNFCLQLQIKKDKKKRFF